MEKYLSAVEQRKSYGRPGHVFLFRLYECRSNGRTMIVNKNSLKKSNFNKNVKNKKNKWIFQLSIFFKSIIRNLLVKNASFKKKKTRPRRKSQKKCLFQRVDVSLITNNHQSSWKSNCFQSFSFVTILFMFVYCISTRIGYFFFLIYNY